MPHETPAPTAASPAACRPPTGVAVLVAVQRGELLAVVAAEGVSGVALVGAQPQPVALGLGLQVEAAVLGVHLLARPVLQLHQQLVVALFPQVVDVVQTQPVLAIYVPEAFLQRGHVHSKKTWLNILRVMYTFKSQASHFILLQTKQLFSSVPLWPILLDPV